MLDFFFLVISICTELLCFGRGFLIEYSLIIKRPVTEVRLIAAAAGLWSPLNNFLAFQIFLSFLSFFKTIGAGKIFGYFAQTLSFT